MRMACPNPAQGASSVEPSPVADHSLSGPYAHEFPYRRLEAIRIREVVLSWAPLVTAAVTIAHAISVGAQA